jgi:eukaryotic translation initiation factor 2C
LKANFFKLDFRKVDYIFHYDVEIEPEKTPISECRDVVKRAVDKYMGKIFDGHRPAFDGRKNLYSSKKLSAVDGRGVSCTG